MFVRIHHFDHYVFVYDEAGKTPVYETVFDIIPDAWFYDPLQEFFTRNSSPITDERGETKWPTVYEAYGKITHFFISLGLNHCEGCSQKYFGMPHLRKPLPICQPRVRFQLFTRPRGYAEFVALCNNFERPMFSGKKLLQWTGCYCAFLQKTTGSCCKQHRFTGEDWVSSIATTRAYNLCCVFF